MESLIKSAGLEDRIQVDSAGTSDCHIGDPADRRAQETARDMGLTIKHRGRQLKAKDLDAFDYVIAMDQYNLKDIQMLAGAALHRAQIRLLRDFDREAGEDRDVPDPYYGESDGFRRVFDICMRGCKGLLQEIRATHDI